MKVALYSFLIYSVNLKLSKISDDCRFNTERVEQNYILQFSAEHYNILFREFNEFSNKPTRILYYNNISPVTYADGIFRS